MDFARRLDSVPVEASRDLHEVIQLLARQLGVLQTQLAATQTGVSTITGSAIGVPTGLLTVKSVTAAIDNGSTAHNFWVSCTPSKVPGAVDLFVWQPTAAGNNTPVAGTTAVPVRWIATGSI
jgi:hypothetical protein